MTSNYNANCSSNNISPKFDSENSCSIQLKQQQHQELINNVDHVNVQDDHRRSHADGKKVKFGAGDGDAIVETFLYDKHPVESTISNKLLIGKRPQLAVSPTKLKVEIVDCQAPIQISPPVAELSFSSSSWDHSSRPSSADPTGSVNLPPLPAPGSAALARPLLTSTPFPQYQQQGMEYDHDNPFRPNGALSHEVEPIVEEYKHKPFPNSPNRSAAHSPLPLSHQQENLTISLPSQCSHDTPDSKLRLLKDNTSPGVASPTTAGNGLAKNTLAGSKNNYVEQADVQCRIVTPTKAGRVEMVHVESKKRKCGCCPAVFFCGTGEKCSLLNIGQPAELRIIFPHIKTVMPTINRKNATKPLAVPTTRHEEQTRRVHQTPSYNVYDDTDVGAIHLPQHAIFPELPTAQGELFFECTLFLYSVLAMFLQYLNLYKTMWWLPHSHVHYSLKFHLIDLYLLSCIGLILGRRVTLCFLKKISLTPPGCDSGNTPIYVTFLEWAIKLPAVLAILSSFSFSFLQVLSSYSWSSLIYVIYPVLFYVLLFYNELFTIFADSATGHGNKSNNFLKSFVLNIQRSPYYVDPMTRHACSLSANSIREEADILIVDFYQRFKQSVFAALTTGYYAIFLPCCFSPHYLYVDIWWSFEVCLIVCATSWTIYTSYLFPLQYCDLLHRSAQHLGAWEKLERQPSHFMQLPIPTWSENYVWNEGSVVKQGRSVYKGQGLIVAAEPSNPDHYRFYALLKDPMLLINGMCGVQACLIFCQFLMLVHSTEWQHIVTLGLLMFANYLLLFKLFKDKIIMGRIYNPNFEEIGLKKLH